MADASANDTFRMPAEWEPHRATWLAWPHRRSDWPGKFGVIPHVYGEIIRVLSRFEEVRVVVESESALAAAQRVLKKYTASLDRVQFEICPTDRSWLRDSGPIFAFAEDGTKTALDWHFNAWAKYDDWKRDDLLPLFVAKRRKVPRVQPKFGKRRVVCIVQVIVLCHSAFPS